MSEFIVAESEIKDTDCLIDALMQMGFKRNQIEVHDTPHHLYGYQGDKRQDVANVIIRKQHVGSCSNDIGFLKGENGKYRAIISQYDRTSHKYNEKWLGKLTGHYAVKAETKHWKKMGYVVQQKTDAKGMVHLQVGM